MDDKLGETKTIDYLENLLDRFKDTDNDGPTVDLQFTSKGGAFANYYLNLVKNLRKLGRDDIFDNEEVRENFDRVLTLMNGVVDILAAAPTDKAREQLITSFDSFYYHLWHLVDQFSREPVTGVSFVVGEHLMRMTSELDRIATPPEDVWSVTPTSSEQYLYSTREERLEEIFTLFKALKPKEPPANEDDCLYLADKSKKILLEAVVALHMPTEVVEISDDDLRDDKLRPTYIDFPCGSYEFHWGVGGRPGQAEIWQRLGNMQSIKDPQEAERIERQKEQSDPTKPANITPRSTRKRKSVNIDDREERRRGERLLAHGKARKLEIPIEDYAKSKKEEWNLEDATRDSLRAIFAREGPEGIEALNTEHMSSKLIYMTMVTHWRRYHTLRLQV
ncbi:hypothetical protein F4821DRAFT_277846 [Hypoxylon rubiginosum]|uniref:Uncharacterized protein n=1 Tax=Hypoxylon rubiginosum TaxID=110542 RepID=A0ACC0D3U3_9PEZI|nr:hypothetical protein F4821DRAFT_277846 [Hypoxylon rubiginosum]